MDIPLIMTLAAAWALMAYILWDVISPLLRDDDHES